MNRKVILLFALYGCAVIGLGIQQYISKEDALETLLPYTHPFVAETEFSDNQILAEIELPSSEMMITERSETEPETIMTDTTLETALPDPTETITYPLDLNTATFDELCTLPGIGEVIAQAICDYREVIGGFRSMHQLLEIYGIGEKKYAAILPYLWLEEEPEPTEPPKPDPPPQEIPPETEPPVIPILNLNTVSEEALMLLPGCSSEIARNILTLRDVQIHVIHNPMEILLAEGVTKELYLMWEPYLAVDDYGSTQLPLD